MLKVMTSQMIWGAQSSGLSCGMRFSRYLGKVTLEHEQDDQRHHEAEQACGFRQSKAEQKVGELPRRRRRIAERALQVVAEDRADADARADQRDRGKACADQFRCCWIHFVSPIKDCG